MSFRTFALTVALIFVFVIPQAQAATADINAEGAARLKKIFENIMLFQQSYAKPGEAKLDYEGEVMVEQADGYYAVTMPHARILYPDGAKLDIGMISVNASPHTQPGQWKMAVAMPTPIIMMDAKQTQAIKITIGAQKASGIWDEDLESFAKLDAQYKNVTAENAATGFSSQLPEAQILYDFVKGADGTWSGPGRFLARGMTMAFTGGSAKIAELKGDFSIEQYNPLILKEYRTYLRTFLADMEKQKQAGTAPDKAKALELANKIKGVILTASNGFAGDYTLTGLEISRSNPVTKTPETLKTEKSFIGIKTGGLKSDKVTLGVHAGYNGFSITPTPKGYEGVLPSEAKIDLALNNVPARQLMEVAQNTLQGSIQQPEMSQLAGMSLILKLPAILSQAGTFMEIKNNYIGNNEYRFDLNGNAKADINAVNNFTADISGKFSGLDGLITKVKAVAVDVNHPGAKNAQGTLRSLETMRTYGKKQPGTEANPVYLYEFKVTPQGQMLMNGAPASFGGMPAVPVTPVTPVP